MSFGTPKVPEPIRPPNPASPATSAAGLGQGAAAAGMFRGFRFAPLLSAFASGRVGRRSMLGGG